MKRVPLSLVSTALIALTPAAVLAHAGSDLGSHHFAGGFVHPFTGLDHIVAMVAVGLWSAQLGGRARWSVPLAFLMMMITGGLLAASHVALPFVESSILASALIIGLLLLFALRVPTVAAVALAGMFAVFHGSAHVAEMPVNASAASYATGFVAASAILLATGSVVGNLLATTMRQPLWLRACGGAVTAAALLIAVA